jgi:hypothetical protein
MKALIDPNQEDLVIQVEQQDFEVANPFYWVDCDDTIVAFQFKYKNNSFVEHVLEYTKMAVNEPTKEELMAQIQALMAKVESLS